MLTTFEQNKKYNLLHYNHNNSAIILKEAKDKIEQYFNPSNNHLSNKKINEYRITKGLPPLKVGIKLTNNFTLKTEWGRVDAACSINLGSFQVRDFFVKRRLILEFAGSHYPNIIVKLEEDKLIVCKYINLTNYFKFTI